MQRKNQVLLSFLKIRAVVNGREIYPLQNTKPIVIGVAENNPRIVITDGYHITKPVKLVFREMHTYCFKVGCAITDLQLAVGSLLLAGLYLGGLYSGLLIMKVFTFFPLLYLLMFYYMNRKDFIKLIPVLD
ncbi:MAG TPA: hypothetical protein VMZ03_01735 [Chitinophagaceae bacterium]|nr:hypothetical protein [Chitinophagaceae bacterium]